MSKSVKVPEDIYIRLKELSEQENIPIGEIVDNILSQIERENSMNGKGVVKEIKEFIENSNFMEPLAQFISCMKTIDNPITSVQNLFDSYKAINAVQELFESGSKNEITRTLFNYLMSNLDVKPVVNQVILKLYILSERWMEACKDREVSFKDWLIEQGIDLTSLN